MDENPETAVDLGKNHPYWTPRWVNLMKSDHDQIIVNDLEMLLLSAHCAMKWPRDWTKVVQFYKTYQRYIDQQTLTSTSGQDWLSTTGPLVGLSAGMR